MISPRRSLVVPVLLSTALLSACGNRSSDTLRQQAAQAALGGGTGGGSGTGSGGSGDLSTGSTGTGTSTGSTGTGSASGSTGSGGSGGSTGSGGATGTGGSGGSGSSTGSGTGSAVPAGGNGGSTDVGVTATTLKVGLVADISGPRPGLFAGAAAGTRAYFAKVNSEGGVFGRQLLVDIGDSQLDCAQNKQKHEQRIDKVFAFVGSFSLNDDCGNDVLAAHPDVPDVHAALGAKAQKLPTNFSIAPLGGGWRTGPLEYWKAKFPSQWTHIGAIFAGVGTGPTIWTNTAAAIEHTGGKVVHAESYGATDSNFTGAVVRMQSDNVQMIYVNTTDGPTGANLVKAIRQQNLNWPIVFGATAYAPDFLDHLSTSESEGVLNDQQFAQFFNADDAAVIPNVAQFQKWMKIVQKDQQMDIFAAYGWAEAQLFVQALTKAGPKATRKGVLAQLQQIHSFTADGMFAEADPASKKPAVCWLANTVKNGKFVRIDPPAPKFRCDGTYFVNPG